MTELWAVIAAASLAAAAVLCPPRAISILLTLATGLYITDQHPAWLVVTLLVLAAPAIWNRHQQQQRLTRLETDLPLFCDQVATGLKAGLSLESAWQAAGVETREPLKSLHDAISGRVSLGAHLDEAVARELENIESVPFDRLSRILHLARDTGLDLGKLLAALAVDVREEAQAENRVRALSAQGRMQALVLGLMPLLLLGLLSVIEPQRVLNFVADPRGQLMLVTVLVMEGIGLLWIRRLVRI